MKPARSVLRSFCIAELRREFGKVDEDEGGEWCCTDGDATLAIFEKLANASDGLPSYQSSRASAWPVANPAQRKSVPPRAARTRRR